MTHRYWLMAMLLWSCADTPSVVADATNTALTMPELWQKVSAQNDPFLSHRPAELECGLGGVVIEDGILEVDTGRCNYFAASQPLRRDLHSGQTLLLTLYHDDLFSEDGGSAHIALMIDEQLLWETNIEIPSESRLFTTRIPLSDACFVGEEVYFHLHNHGVNHWRLVSLTLDSTEPR
jgi:hypothetical protein